MPVDDDKPDPTDTSDAPADATTGAGVQRIDKWLWFARVVKTRSLATRLVNDGKVRIDGQKVEKPAHTVRPGDVLTIAVARRIRVLEVADVGARRGPAPEAAALYVDRTPEDESAAPLPGLADLGGRARGEGRPTKRDRRRLDAMSERARRDPSDER